jgi:hypothetical protein
MAPETLQVFSNEENLLEAPPTYTVKSDIWSFGVLLWEIFTWRQNKPYHDWPNNTDYLAKFIAGERLPIPKTTPQNLYVFEIYCFEIKKTLFIGKV